jgi:L-alanine-DL-glutamate epimerase-like enolase superfamily enzyme
MAGVHVTAATANVMWQETVRAHVRTLYPLLLDEVPVVENGAIELPTRPGLGVRLLEELFDKSKDGYRVSKL